MREFRSFIAGQWVGGGAEMPNINPSDLSTPVGVAYALGSGDVDDAVTAAQQARASWAATNILERHDVLAKVSALIAKHRTDIARSISSEEGKVLSEGLAEADRASRLFGYFAAEAVRIVGDTVASMKKNAEAEIVREPVGVVGLICPWNFPFAIPSWKIAPALAFGNTVVMKASEETPWSAVWLARVLQEAGLPPGVFNLVLGAGATVGQAIADHPGVQAVSFTGSTATGRLIAGRVAGRFAKVQLEMGGKNPMVVLNDADVSTAVDCAMAGLYFGTGQKCTSSSRFIVEDGIHDAFVEALVARLKKTKVGHALEQGSQIGPVANKAQLEKDLQYIDIGRKEGAEVAVGGAMADVPFDGYYLSPTLFVGTKPTMRINREEIFGPVASVVRVGGYDEALSLANDTEYGLSAGICTNSLRRAAHFKRNAQAGVVTVNLPTSGGDFHVSFGGLKASGYGGKEQGQYARDFFTNLKSCYVQPY